MSLSPISLDDECTLVGVVGRRYERPLSEDVRPFWLAPREGGREE